MGIQGVHIALTVRDLSVSGPWYKKLFDGQRIFEGPDNVSEVEIYQIPDNLLLGLRQHAGTPVEDRFTHERCGLDHLAMHVSDREELDRWQAKLDEAGLDHSGIVKSPFGHHLNFRDPDGIALELFLPAPRQ